MKTLLDVKDDFINLRIRPTGWLGDAPSRFDTYTKYASRCDSVCEFGVYTGLSTTAFILANPKKMRSYDIYPDNFLVRKDIEKHARQHHIDFRFINENSLHAEIEETDLLFLDTVHEKDHVYAELNRHSSKTKKYILIHDAANPEVLDAVFEFIKNQKHWIIEHHCNQGSGFIVLERKEKSFDPTPDRFFGDVDNWNF
jgi:hypothetical protein